MVSWTISVPRGHIQCLMRYLVANGPSESIVYKKYINNNNKLQFSISFWFYFKAILNWCVFIFQANYWLMQCFNCSIFEAVERNPSIIVQVIVLFKITLASWDLVSKYYCSNCWRIGRGEYLVKPEMLYRLPVDRVYLFTLENAN